jgi:hypothetical protein
VRAKKIAKLHMEKAHLDAEMIARSKAEEKAEEREELEG